MAIAGAILGVYLLLMGGVTLTQRSMMYFPTKGPPGAFLQLATQQGFEPWKTAAGEDIGWKRLSTNQLPAQVMILHGNGGHALLWASHADRLQSLGAYDVYILEFPGYGARPGKPGQKSIFAAAAQGISLLNTNRKTFLLGESLGTGVASYLAGRARPPVAGVILIAPYNNMAAVAQSHIRIFPVRWMLWDKYKSDEYLKTYAGSVVMLVGGRDKVIPSRYGRRLYDSYQGPKRIWEISDAGHDQLHFAPSEWWQEALEFLQKNQKKRPSGA